MRDIEKRKEMLVSFLKTYQEKLYYVLAAIIIWIGCYIRTRNLPLINDRILIDPDAFLFLRYTREIVANGHLPLIDVMRYYPIGYNMSGEVTLLSYIIAYSYKLFHLFLPSLTIEKATIWYPVIAFAIGTFLFFLLINRLINTEVALMATALLTVVPAYLFRTTAGCSDKEAFAMVTFFLVLYLYVIAIQSKTLTKKLIFGALSGLTTGIMGLSWGGVNFIFLIFGGYILFKLALGNATKEDVYIYSMWFIISTLINTTIGRYSIEGLMV